MGSTALVTSNEIIYLAVDTVKPNPYQPRKFFERASLEELSNSIKQYGVMQPISVRLINGYTYELVAGERRLRATKMAGLSTIPAIVVNVKDQDSAILAIIENLQRQNLNYLEEAEGFQNLVHDYSFTQEELAQRVGKSQSTVANKMRILRLSKPIQKILMENDLSERHARALLKLEHEALQLEVLDKVVKDGLTVKKTEDLVEQKMKREGNEKKGKPQFKFKYCVKDLRIFTNTIKQAVDVISRSGIAADYYIEENADGCEIKIKIVY